MKKFANAIWMTLLASAIGGCMVGDTSKGVSIASGGDDVQLKSDVRQPALEGELVDLEITTDALELRYAGDAPDFAPGNVVFGAEGAGYLRRVTAVEDLGNTVRLTTVPADLGDAFERIDVDARAVQIAPAAPLTLAALNTQQELPAADGRIYRARITSDAPAPVDPNRASATVDFTWEYPNLAITLEDPSGNVAMTVEARTLRVQKHLTLDFGVRWSAFKLKDLRFVVDDQTTYSIEQLAVTVNAQLPRFTRSIPLFDNPAIAVAPVGPFVFTLGGKLAVGVDALVSASAEVHTTSAVSYTTHTTRGGQWNGTFTPIDRSERTVDSDVGDIDVGKAEAKIEADLLIDASLRFTLWGVLGPELWAQISPVSADLIANLTGWQLSLGAHATGGLRFLMPFFKLDALDVNFGRWEETYFQTGGTW